MGLALAMSVHLNDLVHEPSRSTLGVLFDCAGPLGIDLDFGGLARLESY